MTDVFLPWPLLAAFVTAMGCAIGSFLNVCIYRMPRDLSVVSPPSSCPACGTQIRWYHNVPVLGWLVLRGRCADCRAPISARYPIVEAITGAVFLLHLVVIGVDPLLPVRLAFAAAMIVLFAIDLEHQILPDAITLPGIVLGLAASLFLPPGWLSSLIGIVVGGGLPWALAEVYVRVRGVEGLGFGDVKMLAMIGAVLGWPLMLLTLLLASLAGTVVGVGLIAAGRGGRHLRLPFGTFLAIAAVVAGLYGQPVVDWYAGFLH
jgi:leader peptidase (prepilin peptidase)/N-methyltransferase